MFGALYLGQTYIGGAGIRYRLPDVYNSSTRPSVRAKKAIQTVALKSTRAVTKYRTEKS